MSENISNPIAGECCHDDCHEKAKWGNVDPTTGKFIKYICKKHKVDGVHSGRGPNWLKRYKDFQIITHQMNSVLLDTIEEWESGILESGNNYKPKIQCKICQYIVITTRVCNTENGILGCICRSEIPWKNRYDEFKNTLENNNDAILLDTKDEWEIGTLKSGSKYKPKIQCKRCQDIITTTTIDS